MFHNPHQLTALPGGGGYRELHLLNQDLCSKTHTHTHTVWVRVSRISCGEIKEWTSPTPSPLCVCMSVCDVKKKKKRKKEEVSQSSHWFPHSVHFFSSTFPLSRRLTHMHIIMRGLCWIHSDSSSLIFVSSFPETNNSTHINQSNSSPVFH